ncbi:uncharacterized protein [Euphorbia lathyris]|uniref:uncharacterized protein n=1 Tax=Euphorbia lathyris TaxID=212925 RepID=UPI0033135C43
MREDGIHILNRYVVHLESNYAINPMQDPIRNRHAWLDVKQRLMMYNNYHIDDVPLALLNPINYHFDGRVKLLPSVIPLGAINSQRHAATHYYTAPLAMNGLDLIQDENILQHDQPMNAGEPIPFDYDSGEDDEEGGSQSEEDSEEGEDDEEGGSQPEEDSEEEDEEGDPREQEVASSESTNQEPMEMGDGSQPLGVEINQNVEPLMAPIGQAAPGQVMQELDMERHEQLPEDIFEFFNDDMVIGGLQEALEADW